MVEDTIVSRKEGAKEVSVGHTVGVVGGIAEAKNGTGHGDDKLGCPSWRHQEAQGAILILKLRGIVRLAEARH